MTKITWFGAGLTVASFLLVGCGERTPAEGGMRNMQEAQQARDDAAEHIARGTINSVDPTEGTVNISHDPVPSAGWPAMTMNFQLADSDLAAAAPPGQRVQFRFTISPGSSATVTAISPAEEAAD